MFSPETKIKDIIPVIGLGTWNMSGKTCIESVRSGLDTGYRHLDTAQNYGNEREVGKGLKESGIDRQEVFITTKVAYGNLTASGIRSSLKESLKKLDSDYVDLLLIHWPTSSMDLKECLDTMFELKDEEKVKFVGVSNFSPELFREAVNMGPVANNQVKFSPHDPAFETLETIKETGKTLTAYSPLERGEAVNDDIFKEMEEKYNKSASQIILRWLIQLGNVSVIPKASSEDHRKENLDIFDFELSNDEMERLIRIVKQKI
ncbi:MAG: aldo/keto reductase [Bacteroidota bacterium]